MASNKIYTVVKDGEELEQFKTLAAAKKLADTEGGEVYTDGKCVYHAEIEQAPEQPTNNEQPVADTHGALADAVKEVFGTLTEPPKAAAPAKPTPYRLKAIMNVRKEPSMIAEILGVLKSGEIVHVKAIEDGWMEVVYKGKAAYILYEGGKWAVKV